MAITFFALKMNHDNQGDDILFKIMKKKDDSQLIYLRLFKEFGKLSNLQELSLALIFFLFLSPAKH